MILQQLSILNYKNIRDAQLNFADKLNCFIGLNGQGKTNLLDAIYYLSFTKSAYNTIDSLNITHGENFALIQGLYDNCEPISCGIKHGTKKQFRKGKKDYKRLIDHIGLIPLVMVSPQDNKLISDGSEERRRFMDSVIAQTNKNYLEQLTTYNALLKQRNALLKQYENHSANDIPIDLFQVIEAQLTQHANYIFQQRTLFIQQFIPYFQEVYNAIADDNEQVTLRYTSQLQTKQLSDAFAQTINRDLILGWTSQGIHKDELQMELGNYPLRQVASQGQQKTFLIAMKLGQALYLDKPILLLDDIFDKLDSQRVERIVKLVDNERFGQIFITDTDRKHLSDIIQTMNADAAIFHVTNGQIEH